MTPSHVITKAMSVYCFTTLIIAMTTCFPTHVFHLYLNPFILKYQYNYELLIFKVSRKFISFHSRVCFARVSDPPEVIDLRDKVFQHVISLELIKKVTLFRKNQDHMSFVMTSHVKLS